MQEIKLKYGEKYESEKLHKCYVPKRYVLALLGCFGLFNVYAMRVNLSVAMVAMVNQTAISHLSPNSSLPQDAECVNLFHEDQQEHDNEGFKGDQYDWDARTQGRILGSFFYGYIITQIPGGIMSEKFGAKWLFGGGILVTSIFSLITPLAASWGTVAFIVVRIVEGLGEGVTYPAINFAISTWSPRLERSRISTLINMGSQIGSFVSMPVSGLLCSTDLFGGWPSVFYVFGGLGCIWFIFWCFFMHEKPSEHPSISKEEFLYIEQNNDKGLKKKSSTPWKSIFTSLPMWSCIFAHFGHSFGYYVLLTEIPTYLSTILHFDIKANGVLSAVPFMAKPVTTFMASVIADKLREHKTMSITNIRRMCNSIGLFGPAFCLIGVSAAGCHPELTLALLSLAMALNGFVYSGFNITHVDMSPDFAGTLYSITNTISNLCGILAPMVVGIFTVRGATLKNWSYVFYIAAAIYVTCGTFFALFSSAELQPWGLYEDDTQNTDESLKDDKIEKDVSPVETKKG